MPKKNNKIETRDEFRYNYYTKHANYIFEKDNDDYHSLGLTHHKKTYDYKKKKWRRNMPLYDNPNKNDFDKSYIRYGVITQNCNTYSNIPNKNFSFSNRDKSKVKSIIRNFKNNRRKSK